MSMDRMMFLISALLGVVLAVLPHVVYLVVLIVGRIAHFRVAYPPYGWTALALAVLVWVLMAYGYYVGRYRMEVNQVEYSSADLPEAFDGFRLVHISDIHAGTFDQRPEALQRIVDSINAQEVDLVCFTGDMATISMDEVVRHAGALSSLRAREGVVSSLGNHDFFIYSPSLTTDAQRESAADRLARYERDTLGWRVLRNENIVLHRGADSIAIAGVDNIHGSGQGFATIQKGDLQRATRGTGGLFTVLLSHDPSHWEAEVLPRSHVQLTLSGHTHAAQIRILGWSLANLMFHHCDGAYTNEQGRMLYVNAGLGCTAPFRIACPSEVTVITLRRK